MLLYVFAQQTKSFYIVLYLTINGSHDRLISVWRDFFVKKANLNIGLPHRQCVNGYVHSKCCILPVSISREAFNTQLTYRLERTNSIPELFMLSVELIGSFIWPIMACSFSQLQLITAVNWTLLSVFAQKLNRNVSSRQVAETFNLNLTFQPYDVPIVM